MDGPLTSRGRAMIERHEAHEAIDVLRRAVAAGEQSAPELLVQAYLDSGAWAEAVAWLAPRVEQGQVEFAGRLGVALAELGYPDRAEEALRLALRHGERVAANDLALLLREQGRFAEALTVLRNAAEAGEPQAQDNLVALLLEDGDVGAAVAAAERYADEARPDTLVALADARAATGREDEARALYERAGELDALRAHTAYGIFLVARGDNEGAGREFAEAERQREPGWAYTVGRFLIDTGRPQAARWYLETAAREGDRHAAETLALLDDEDPTDD